MAQPTPYTRQYDFTDHSTNSPTTPQPGVHLDAEFNAVKLTTDQIRANLALIQRDDGKIANTSVHKDAFDAGALALIGGSTGWEPRGDWTASGTLYSVKDMVEFDGATYVCAVAHTSSAAFDTDRDAGRWLKLFGGKSDSVVFTPYDTITATNVQGAIEEVQDEWKAAAATTDQAIDDLESDVEMLEARPRRFDTLANAEAYTPDTAPTFIDVAGYSAPGDGGGAVYRKVGAEPAHEGKFSVTLADGETVVWYELAPVGPITPQKFGAKADGVFAVDGAVTAADTTFTSATAAFAAADVGKLIKVGGAGASGATLITTIASVNSGTSVELADAAGTTVTGANYTYGTDDLTAVENARDYCWAFTNSIRGGLTLYFPDGRYCLSGGIEFARSYFTVAVQSDQVWLESFRTTSGPAISCNGLTYDSTYGVYNFTFGGAYIPNIRGNSNCSAGLYYNNTHKSDIAANVRDANIGILGDNTGSSGGPEAAAVTTRMRFRVKEDDLDEFDVQPSVGWYCSYTYACTIEILEIEKCGSATPTFGVYMAESNGNTILGGTVESNSHGGIHIATTCERNTWLNMHNELNGSGPDWKIEGNYNILIGCAGVATAASLATAANIINGDYNQIIGGVYDDLEIGSGASNNISTGAKMSGGTVSDNGTDSTFLDCPGVVDKAPAPAPSALTLATNVGEYSLNGHQPPRYYRTRSGTVGVIGAVVTSAQINSPYEIATLPVSYRPPARFAYTGYNLSTETAVGLTISADGIIRARAAITSGHIVDITSPMFIPD